MDKRISKILEEWIAKPGKYSSSSLYRLFFGSRRLGKTGMISSYPVMTYS